MTTNTLNKPDEPHLAFQENDEEVELQWPQPERSVDDALLIAFKHWVLRFILSNIATPNQILNAMRRLEVMKEFPLRQEKQSRTLALAEARVELRRRALELREAQLKENKEKREAAAAKAEAIATARAAKAAEKAARENAKALLVAKPAPPVPSPAAIQKAGFVDKSPIETPQTELKAGNVLPVQAPQELPTAYEASLIQLAREREVLV